MTSLFVSKSLPVAVRGSKKSHTKGGEIRDTKTQNMSHNIASLQVLGRCFPSFSLREQLDAVQSKSVLYFSQQLSSTATIVSAARRIDRPKMKNAKHAPKLE